MSLFISSFLSVGEKLALKDCGEIAAPGGVFIVRERQKIGVTQIS